MPSTNVADVKVKVDTSELGEAAQELQEISDLAPLVIKESKAGYKTTEFWIGLFASVAVVLNGIPAPESKEGYIVAAIAAVYTISRGIAKSGVAHVEAPAPV